jgi:hypothetical protein
MCACHAKTGKHENEAIVHNANGKVKDANHWIYKIVKMRTTNCIYMESCYQLESCSVISFSCIQLFQLRLSTSKAEKSNTSAKGCWEPLWKCINLLAIPSSLSRSYSTFPLCSWTTLIEIAVYNLVVRIFPIEPFNI